MPEIGEVARIVHYLRKYLVGKTLAVVKAQHDENVYGKVDTTAAAFEEALTGKKIVGAGQQGKYFWLVMSSPPHPLFHFGMTGWWKIRGEETAYYNSAKPEEPEPEWPPKYWKFLLETSEEPKCESAFVDSRRFARIRLLECAAADIRQISPLKENGPDPVLDKETLTEEWLIEKMRGKKIPVKALLLDQANISGIGNWVGDEILYGAAIHPEQYSNTLSDDQLRKLHECIHQVCSTAVETQADSSRFPENWLMKHRWGKGKKGDANKLPNGAKIEFVTVGGRTSAVVPSVQKKTGPVAGDVKKEADQEKGESTELGNKVSSAKTLKSGKKNGANKEGESSSQVTPKHLKDSKTTNNSRDKKGKQEPAGDDTGLSKSPAKKRKAPPNGQTNGNAPKEVTMKKAKPARSSNTKEESQGRRRSARVSGRDV
ncbi:MAG: formamidopyrimidine-DNA glycosylase [Lasallia pustulata]|uniref:Formamidopyrimidine-DNA glycosylase n=1 Tax=Lasallia pustulata TaxID=136370 RepID=A0A5M8PN84_9LECA|nr:MAG: formamidopyrimidine-DNA glycosylase [Lasallia pustulata]